jgi:predicted flap endonuclease-1-like 5' DNA nuclease
MRIKSIEGIGPAYAEALAKAGIKTTEELLEAAASKKGRQALAEKTDLSEKRILEWTNRADLMRVRGVGEEYSDLLEAAGVDTVKELRNRNPDNLYAALLAVNDEKHLVRRPPSKNEVASWVKFAKTLKPLLTY